MLSIWTSLKFCYLVKSKCTHVCAEQIQLIQSAQADMHLDSLLPATFLHAKGPIYDSVRSLTKLFYYRISPDKHSPSYAKHG